jgi:phospholipid/cholesterol/gamma-HCH transport system substrate-binding protein
MKKNKGNNIRLGVFVAASLILFITGIYMIGSRQQLFGGTFRVHCLFRDISGLQVGNNVRFSGITVGVVDEIEQVNDSMVRVDLVINRGSRTFIKKNAVASIGSDGLMGNRIVVIAPGEGIAAKIADNDLIRTDVPVNIDDILLQLKMASENSVLITRDLATITDNVSAGKGTIGMLLMDSTFAFNLSVALENISEGAGGFKRNMDKAGHSFLLKGHVNSK